MIYFHRLGYAHWRSSQENVILWKFKYEENHELTLYIYSENYNYSYVKARENDEWVETYPIRWTCPDILVEFRYLMIGFETISLRVLRLRRININYDGIPDNAHYGAYNGNLEKHWKKILHRKEKTKLEKWNVKK